MSDKLKEKRGDKPTHVIGVLALQGAFEEHVSMVNSLPPLPQSTGSGEAIIVAVQIKTKEELLSPRPETGRPIDGLILPGGESTAIGLIGNATPDILPELKKYVNTRRCPVWGTCAGMILLSDRSIGNSPNVDVGRDGGGIIGGIDVTVCRNYFGSQISSFQVGVDMPVGFKSVINQGDVGYPAVFIRAPAILDVGESVEVVGDLMAVPCKTANACLVELQRRIDNGEDITKKGGEGICQMGQVDGDKVGMKDEFSNGGGKRRKIDTKGKSSGSGNNHNIKLPGATILGGPRKVVIAAKRDNAFITAFHPELTEDTRFHEYWVREFVLKSAKK